MRVAVVVGNPKPASRTREAAERLAESIAGHPPDVTIDIVDLGADVLRFGSDPVREAIESVKRADLLVVGSPTFKGTYSGVLKVFLDQFETGVGLGGVIAVPLMLGAGPGHAMAPDLLLKPVLIEIGATCPTAGLYVLDSTYDDPASTRSWLDRWLPVLQPLLT